MNLRARRLEKEILRRHKAARRQSTRLKEADKRARRRWRNASFFNALVQFWPLFPVVALLAAGREEAAHAAAALYALGTALVRAAELQLELRHGTDVAVLGTLPASDELLFGRAWRRLVLGSILAAAPFAWLAVDAVGVGDGSWRLAAATSAVTLSAGVVISCAALAGLLRSRLVAPLGALIQLAVMISGFNPDRVPIALSQALHNAVRALPGGWITQALQQACRGGDPAGLTWLGPALLLVATLPWTLKRLRQAHQTAEIVMPTVGPVTARFEREPEDSVTPEPSTRSDAPDVPTSASPGLHDEDRGRSATIEEVAAGLRPLSAGRHWPVEASFLRTLDRREQAVWELLVGIEPAWASLWKVGGVMSGVGLLLGLGFPQLSSLCVMLVCAGALIAIPALGGAWPAFELVRAGGAFSPLLAPYPIGYGEACRTMLKANLVRLIAGLPHAMAAGMAIGNTYQLSTSEGLWLGARLLLLILALQPAMLVFKFARVTNELDNAVVKCIAIVVLLIGFGVVLFGVTLCLPASTWGEVLGGLAIIALPAACLLLAYGAFYGRPLFDLVRSRRDELHG